MATPTELEAAVQALLVDQDLATFRSVLHDRCQWDDCVDADAVIRTMDSMLRHGAEVRSSTTTTVNDRIVSAVEGALDGELMTIFLVMLVEDGLIAHIIVAPDEATALTVQPHATPASPDPAQAGPRLNSLAAILPCRDVAAALAHYELLGFSTHSYDDGYGYADRDGVSFHLAKVPDLDPLTTTSAAYLFVDNAAALHVAWRASGAGGRFTEPEATPYGLLEGAHIDPDGNLLRYGSRLA
jgi:hypothetical protein